MAKSDVMNSNNANTRTIIATCPACGLLCDDVLVENNQNKIKVLANGCAKSVTFFEQATGNITPSIAGKPATLDEAIAKAAQILKTAHYPLFAGLSTDVQGFRAVYDLAQKSDATLQHMNTASSQRNLRVLQSTGWQTTTLTEVKNRADVIVCIGTDVVTLNPRFFERFIQKDGMFIDAKQREIIFIGEDIQKNDALESASLLACRAYDLPEITLALRALVLGKKLKAAQIAGIQITNLQAVADKLKQAKYAVLAWVAKDLDYPHAELTIQNITETVAILNQTTRAAGLPLGGSDGDTGANYANAWLSGLTLNDNPSIQRDAVVWINSSSADKNPPLSDSPLIVLGNANSQFETEPEVFIPIATPGLDCSGTLFRVDSSVILPLKKCHETNLPTLSEVVNRIEAMLP
ncbi:MAG: formylmethanofuran dehydrogenase [Methylotenera sp.]